MSSLFFFFFSSRRRHTRYWRDWSSDVCSSDLVPWMRDCVGGLCVPLADAVRLEPVADGEPAALWEARVAIVDGRAHLCRRSEERRVGKEGRSRGAPYH